MVPQFAMAWRVDQEEFLMGLGARIVFRAIFVGARNSSNWQRTFDCEWGLGGMSFGSCAPFKLFGGVSTTINQSYVAEQAKGDVPE